MVLEAEDAADDPSQFPEATWDDDLRAWRVPAAAHADVIVRCSDSGIRISDEIAPVRISGEWALPSLRWYQSRALEAWEQAQRCGVIALPTGSGKTLVALAAIARLAVATLIIVPTRVLLDQWARALALVHRNPVGRLGDGDHQVLPITVATYASAAIWAPRIGDHFGLVIVDEAHHVGAWCPSEILEMLPAAARLGLTATPPEADGALTASIGPVLYALSIDDLAGDALAPYDLRTVPVRLEPQERVRYRAMRSRFAAAYRDHARRNGRGDWNEFMRAATRSTEVRDGFEAWRGYRSLLAYSEGKRVALREILARHPGARTLIFTADNATAYAIARELLVMPITHEIDRAERASVLSRFRAGEISVLVSSQVLDEGLDVPDADIAIIVGGTASARRHVQRIGRVLRPRDGKQAIIYELEISESTEHGSVQRRRVGLADRYREAGGMS